MGIDPIEPISPNSSLQSTPQYAEQSTKHPQHDSTLAKASTSVPAYTPCKPCLNPPTSPLCQTFASLEKKVEPLLDRWMNTRKTFIESQIDDIYAKQVEQAKKIEESCLAEKDASFWGILEDLSGTVSAAVGFFFGTSATLSGNPILGGALITSGVLTIGNIAFKHGNVWGWVADKIAGNDPKLKEQILTYLPSAVGLSATTLSFAGSLKAWKYAGQTGFQVTNHLFNSTAKISFALIDYKSNMAKSNLNFKRAVLEALQSKITLSNIDLDRLVRDVKEHHEHQVGVHKTFGNILEERDQAIQQIQQPV